MGDSAPLLLRKGDSELRGQTCRGGQLPGLRFQQAVTFSGPGVRTGHLAAIGVPRPAESNRYRRGRGIVAQGRTTHTTFDLHMLRK